MKALDVWMNGELVGQWVQGRGRGSSSFEYDATWLQSPRCRPLSLSIPIPIAGGRISSPAVNNYFDNLLPDNPDVRRRISGRLHVDPDSAFDMLTAIGRDCVGAVQLMPAGQPPGDTRLITGISLTDDDIETMLRDRTWRGPPGRDEPRADDVFRISLAGMQEKTALLSVDGKWYEPTGATPTTHILKPPMVSQGMHANVRIDHSVENEWLCAQILGLMGFDVATTNMARFGNQQALVVERFDRQLREDDGKKWLARLPQEDFCQITGTPSDSKYESNGGPGIAKILQILRGSQEPLTDQWAFVRAQFAFWLLAATDGHAKNFSVFNHAGGEFSLTPLYDVISMWPYIGRGQTKIPLQKVAMAMALRGNNPHYKLSSITARHWLALGAQVGRRNPENQFAVLADQALAAVDQAQGLIPPGFPGHMYQQFVDGVSGQVRRFREQLANLRQGPG